MVQVGVKYNLLITFLLFIIFSGCKTDPKTEPQTEKPKEVLNKLKIPPFNADSAYLYIEQQVELGPRVPDTEAHANAIIYFKDKLESFGAQVRLQPMTKKRYDGVTMNGTNVIASYNPEIKDRIFLCAHWDARFMGDKDKDPNKRNKPIDGADDGGSGVGVLLEIARQLKETPLVNIGLDIVLFDLEDQGQDGGGDADSWGIGAQHWASNLQSGYKPRFGILLDMVGSTNARFDKEGHSYTNARSIVDKVWRLAKGIGYGNHFVQQVGHPTTDDHYFVMRESGIPCINIINRHPDGRFGNYHHTHDDNMDVINKTTLKAVGQTTLAAVYHYHNGTF